MKTTQFIENQSPILHYFDQIYIINLETRVDRRKEVEVELANIGISLSHPNVKLFRVKKPTDFEGWPSAGTKGCFLSHLNILKDAQKNQYERILILEDDVQFINNFNQQMKSLIPQLNSTAWDVFYGGYEIDEQTKTTMSEKFKNSSNNINIYISGSNTHVMCTHFVAFNQSIIVKLIKYLEAMMIRPAGDPAGGPMHVDGAYSWFRRENHTIQTVLAHPRIAIQRSSRTDIHDLNWMDEMLLIKDLTSIARKIKNNLAKFS